MIENDAVITAPTEAWRRAHGMDELRSRIDARARVIAMARADPYRFGYEPDMWLVARAMLGLQRIPEVVLRRLAERTGMGAETCWQDWSDALCSRLGMASPVMELLLLGANSSGKTDVAAKICNEVALGGPARKIMVGSQKWEKSVEVQQARVWQYIPAELRRNVVTDRAYIRYKEKNGFTGNSFINDAGCRVGFVFYTQQREDVFEGGKENFVWFDEEFPMEWAETSRYRIARVMGKALHTFTPVSGYTPAVADYLDGMRVVRWSHGYMLPRDGGEPAPWHALGLAREELAELERWSAEVKRKGAGAAMPQTVPGARSEDCVAWAAGGERSEAGGRRTEDGGRRAEDRGRRTDGEERGTKNQEPRTMNDELIDGNREPKRVWERVPRVALCRDPQRAVLWFHGRDNPYGNPWENIKKAMENPKARDEIRTRVYGIALKRVGKRFAAFDRGVHVCGMSGDAGLRGGAGDAHELLGVPKI